MPNSLYIYICCRLPVKVPFRETPCYSSRRRAVCISPRRSLMRSASDNALDESLPAPSPAPSLRSLPPLEPDDTGPSQRSPQAAHTHTRSLRRHTRSGGHLRCGVRFHLESITEMFNKLPSNLITFPLKKLSKGFLSVDL